MLNTININLKTDIKTDRPTTLPIKLMSQDKNNNQFILRFTNGGEAVVLDDTYTVEILTKFAKSGASRLTSAKVRQDYATWEFDTAYITQDEAVYNFVYVRKSGNLVVSADANCFVFNVDLSEIDKGAGKVAETYDENYEKYLDEFKGNVDFEEIAQAEQARKEAETLREDNYEQLIDTALVEADVVEKVDNKVTELTPQISNLTAQLAQKANGKFYRSSGAENQPNLVAGSIHNRVEDGYTGNLIAGGGTAETHANVIGGNVDAIGNPNLSNYATPEILATNTNSNLSTILGGYDNVVQGIANNVSGHHNGIRFPTNHSSIAGGVFNLLEWGMGQSIAGGQQNKIRSTSKATQGITDSSAISGGIGNIIDDSLQSTIGGGGSNKIKGSTTAKNANTIGGGTGNSIDNGTSNTIGGGQNNQSPAGSYSTIPGGRDNITTSDYTTAIGSKAKAYAANQIATGFNVSFKETGDAQVSENMKVKTTIDETQTYVNTFLRAGSMAAVNIKVVARRTDVVGDYAVFMIKGAANVSAGSNGTLIGTPVIEKFATAGAANWSATLAMSAAQVLTYVKGEVGKTIQWVVHYEFVENLG